MTYSTSNTAALVQAGGEAAARAVISDLAAARAVISDLLDSWAGSIDERLAAVRRAEAFLGGVPMAEAPAARAATISKLATVAEATPGPWYGDSEPADGRICIYANDQIVGYVSHGSNIDAEARANARLMAAAPAMLWAIQKCMVHEDPLSGSIWGQAIIARLTAALAKARGAA